jgi:hypothetical protein
MQADGPLLPVHSSGTPPPGFNVSTWFNTTSYGNLGGTATRLPSAIGLVNMTNLNNPDPRPGLTSEPATAGVEFVNLNQLAGGFFIPTTYRGAFDPALLMSQQWTAGWTNFDPQNTVHTDVEDITGGTALSYTLAPNYPNPFNPTTTLRFSLPEAGYVTLKVFNMLGQEVATLLDRELNAGEFETEFNASELGSGTYISRLASNGTVLTRKMLLLK